MWSWLQPPGHDLGSLGCGGRALRGPAVQTSARSRAASRSVLGVALSLARSSREPPAKVTSRYLRTQPDIPPQSSSNQSLRDWVVRSVLAERNRAGEIGVLLSVAVFVLCATMYALATPFGQAPDEKSHLAYVQLVAQHLQLPVNSPERQQPPLYYLIAALVYRLTGSIGWVQALSIACGTASVLVSGLGAPELLPAKPKRFVLTALLAATLPQFQFISASVSNDAFAVMVAALITLLMIRVIVRPTVSWLPWAIGLVFAAVLLAKETDYFLIVVVVVMVVRFWPRRDLAGALVPMIGLPAMLAGWWFVRNLTTFDSLL